jgi:ABC-type glycerol-3-phosphate transport system substrate-binding protein
MGMLPLVLAFSIAGCSEPAGPPAPEEPPLGAESAVESAGPLRVIVVDDRGLAEAVRREWGARAEGEVRIETMDQQRLLDPRRKRLDADVVIYPSGCLGELAERKWIAPVPAEVLEAEQFDRRDIFDQIRQQEMVWGEAVYAVPLGSPPLMLLYREDVFEQLEIEAPQDWQQYRALCQRLSDAEIAAIVEGL